MKTALPILLVSLAAAPVLTGWTAEDPIAVAVEVDASESLGTLEPIWRFFGADEPNYAYMTNGRKLLGELGEMSPGNVYFRTHNLLTSGDGTPALKWGSTGVYTENEKGEPVYDWTILDQIFDAYLDNGVRPYVQMGFMPEALSTKPEPYQHSWHPGARYEEIYTGWAYPPNDYEKWAELIYQWVLHAIDRYGREEVETWYWQTWNEANIGYWQGTPEEFYKLHDYSVDAVRRALPTARVGGPDTAGHGGRFMRDFLEHCLRGTNYVTGEIGTPTDFVSFHAKGSPRYVDDHVQMGIQAQLRTIDRGFEMIASYDELADTPIIIGESDPEGCAACQGPQLAYRNGTMYSSYTAASFVRKLDLASRHGVNFDGALTWAFEFEDQDYFAGFRSLASNGIDKPVLNVFRMFSRMTGNRVPAFSDGMVAMDTVLESGVRGEPDIGSMASRDGDTVRVLLWHYHDDDLPGPDANVALRIDGLPENRGAARITHWRIDENHSNAFSAWLRMGSPQEPTREQYRELDSVDDLQQLEPPRSNQLRNGALTMNVTLPRQAVSLLEIEFQ